MLQDELLARLRGFPKVALAHLPTPLEALPSLSSLMAPVSIYTKRDDQTGLAFGGNKARKLEFIMADVVAQGADTVVTWAGVQSNWCRQVAAAAARMSLRTVLVLVKKPGATVAEDGNLLLDRFFGADIRIVEAPGRRASWSWSTSGGSGPRGGRGARGGAEGLPGPSGGIPYGGLHASAPGVSGLRRGLSGAAGADRALGFTPGAVVLASGSAGTQAGLLAGAKLLSPETRIVGISVAGAAR
jgi:L-cysteate sulfo-lyase